MNSTYLDTLKWVPRIYMNFLDSNELRIIYLDLNEFAWIIIEKAFKSRFRWIQEDPYDFRRKVTFICPIQRIQCTRTWVRNHREKVIEYCCHCHLSFFFDLKKGPSNGVFLLSFVQLCSFILYIIRDLPKISSW